MARRPKQEDITPDKLRYILYARKSTEDKGSQERSIGDQIQDCMALAERDGLKIIKIIKEEKSAKIENNRPQFLCMIDQIRKGEADGILSWHPDRLSRNPLESAIIIDLIDKGVIKDLKFPTCQFTNDSSGKMLLNILFAISKQYSEHISEGVIRANDNALEEGKSNGMPKWGYNRNHDGYYTPDDNFQYICTAWKMKISGTNHADILQYLRENDVHRMTKITRKNKTSHRIEPGFDTLATIFKDPFYYGVLVQAGQEVDLTKIPGAHFEPMISYEEYVAAQETGKGRSRRSKKNRAIFLPLRGLVKCGVCGKTMVPGASTGRNAKYLYYRCDNKECPMKSVRAKEIFTPLFEAIRALQFGNNDYAIYNSRVNSLTDEKLIQLRTQKKSLEAKYNKRTAEMRRQLRILSDAKELGEKMAIRQAELDLGTISTEASNLEEQIHELEDKINGAAAIALSQDEFLNLMKTLPDKIENASIAEKDAIIRIMLLNLTIDQQKRPHFLWKEPFKSLLEKQEFNSGARDWT